MTKLNPIAYSGTICLSHTREDIKVLVKAYNLAIAKINELEERVSDLERRADDGTKAD